MDHGRSPDEVGWGHPLAQVPVSDIGDHGFDPDLPTGGRGRGPFGLSEQFLRRVDQNQNPARSAAQSRSERGAHPPGAAAGVDNRGPLRQIRDQARRDPVVCFGIQSIGPAHHGEPGSPIDMVVRMC
jgi:hypothetical protein